MIRATTPTNVFYFPEEVPVTDIDKLLISYVQCGKAVFEKTEQDTEINQEENSVSLDLTQEELNMFKEGVCEIQLRLKNREDVVIVSQIINVKINRVLNQEVL